MKPSAMLTVASLLSLLLFMCHLTGDVLLQTEGAVKYPIPVIIFAVWLYGTLMLSDRVSGYIIMLLGGLVSAGMIVIHSRGGVVHKKRRLLLRVHDVRAQHNGLVQRDPGGPRIVADASRQAIRKPGNVNAEWGAQAVTLGCLLRR